MLAKKISKIDAVPLLCAKKNYDTLICSAISTTLNTALKFSMCIRLC